MSNENKKLPLLITIGPSHYCEKVRWALEYLNIPYSEDAHPPLLHWGTTLRYKSRTVPLFITEDGVFKDSTDIMKYINNKAPEQARLYPEDKELRKETEELEDLFDRKLGPHARRWAYFYLFQKPDIIFKAFLSGAHPFEESMFYTFFPVLKPIMKAGMKINPQTAEISRNKVVEIFDKVEKKLADKRKYLVGDTLSAADITFASLAAPLVLPRGYSLNVPPEQSESEIEIHGLETETSFNEFEGLPAMMIDEIKDFRKSRAGIFALDLYKRHRKKKVKIDLQFPLS